MRNFSTVFLLLYILSVKFQEICYTVGGYQMNFMLGKTGIKVFDEPSKGTNFLYFLSNNKFSKEQYEKLLIKRISPEEDYIGYTTRNKNALHDLLFTKTILKEMGKFINKNTLEENLKQN